MNRIGQSRLELGLLGLIAVACVGLSALQYRWTIEVSDAERTRLRSALTEQVSRFARAFDDDLREQCRALMPDPAEIREDGSAEAHRARYQQWRKSHDARLFARIGVVRPEHGALRLYQLGEEGQLTATGWPERWQPLRDAMAGRLRGTGGPPSIPPDSTLIEFPIFSGGNHHEGSRRELEWMIFEVSEDYLGSKILPRLVSEYLGSGNEESYDVSVSWADGERPVTYSTRPDGTGVESSADATAGIFPVDTAGMGDRRRRHGGQGEPPYRWTLSVRHHDGSLDAAVARTRNRNLITSFVLIGLLGGAAWALVRYTSRSRRLAEMQFRFAAGVSHDLRTPLTAIRGAAYNLSARLVTEPEGIERYANLIMRNAEELTSMIENVLAFSASLHAGRQERREAFAVGDLLEHAASATAQEVEQAGCRVELNVAPDLPTLHGDAGALEHAFRNLISNAARHAAQGRWIGVTAARSAEGVEIRVCDRGPGIAEGERERIFEPFYRGEQTLGAQVRGAGLGLSLVKEAVERHAGTISLYNSPAGGAQFTVRLPALEDAA